MATALRKRKRSSSPFESLETRLFPRGYKLILGTSQIYELELALAESHVLTPEEVVRRGAYFDSVDNVKTHHFCMCAVSPLQVDDSSSSRRRTFFEANLFKTGYATHGLFPYRGKFHPQMIKAIVNIIGLKPGDTLLDPMMGSGTACLEASLQGVNAVGIDASPFCVLMAEGKQTGAKVDEAVVASLEEEADDIFDRFDQLQDVPALFRLARSGNGSPRRADPDKGLDAFLRLCYLDAMGYSARRASKSVRELFPIVLRRYVSAARNFARVRDELDLKLGKATYAQGDARDLNAAGIRTGSIDGIITSPPYSFAIDYLSNDAPQLDYLGIDPDQLRERMVGLRGSSLTERVENYLKDMDRIVSECARVLRAGRFAVVVVGTNSNQLKRAMGSDGEDLRIDRELVRIASDHDLEFAHDVIHPIEGIHNTLRDEHVLFFRKTG